MSKPIKMTEQYIRECRADFEKALQLVKLADGKMNFTKSFSIDDKRAVVYFTGEAWAKLTMLLKNFDKEVAWHGVAHRGEDESKDEYIISDIMVYPQTVTGASVDMDTEKYAMWLMENAEDERFDNIHMQGHSHVNMPTSPSSVDLAHQEEILNMLGDDDFYIFMIWNKSFSSTNKIYDLKKNVLFEDRDITVKLVGAVEDLEAFINSAKEMVITKSVVTQPLYPYTYNQSSNRPAGTPYNTVPAAQSAAPVKEEKGTEKKSGKKEKPKTKLESTPVKNAYQRGVFDMYDDERYYGGY